MRRWRKRGIATAGVMAAVWMAMTAWAPAVLADAPAVTDFGLDEAVPAFTVELDDRGQAAFVTLYADGRGQCVVKTVRGDAVNGFVAEHPAWQLDPALMWFVQMPVYVRHVPAPRSPGVESV
ncbi:MAG: hypothetical protein K6T67_06090 [Alicyclobacillus sp.]|nr:hypothetical protein [Alicyclobacillus sp.]